MANPTSPDQPNPDPLQTPHDAAAATLNRQETAEILRGGGAMGELMRRFDWSRTPVGPASGWPQSLRTALSIMLDSSFPMLTLWGPEYVQFYNDAYRPVLGATKHPGAIGQRGRECWPEIWDMIGPMFDRVLTQGEATDAEDLLFVLDRNGYTEETYFTFCYSAIRDETQRPGGVLVTCVETPARVLSERRLRCLRELAAQAAIADTVDAACTAAVQILAEHAADVPFALLYLLSGRAEQEWTARLNGACGLSPGLPAGPEAIDRVGAEPAAAWPLAEAAVRAEAVLVGGLEGRFGRLPGGPWPEAPQQALVLPIAQPGEVTPAGLLVAGVSPRRALDDEYRGFLDLVAGQIGTAIANARAHEAERLRAEALAELDRAKTAFFGNVSHEFRTPLTLLLGPLEDLLRDPQQPLPADVQERLTMAHRNALRLLRLVNMLLDFSRLEAGRVEASYEPVDLAAATVELASMFRSAIERAGLELIVDCPPLPAPVYVDRDMWEKIVLNLLSNALKFTPAGSIRVSLAARDGRVELTVADTGAGIPEAELPRIFERFHRVRVEGARTEEGTGIGLALVQELVRLHGGSIGVASTPGAGTSFTVSIPLGSAHLPAGRIGAPRTRAATRTGVAPFVEEALRWLPREEATASVAAPAGWDEAPLGGAEPHLPGRQMQRILVVDDNADMRDYLQRLLAPHWQIDLAIDGRAALAAALDDPPDLIVADVMMPGMDGFALVGALRREAATRAVPVILLSARAGEDSRVEGLQAGADDYLVKPFPARELLARVEAHLRLAELRAEGDRRERAARDQLHRLFQQAPAAIAILSGPEHIFTLANARYLELVYPHDVLGRTIREAFPEIEGQGIYELLDQVYETGEPYIGNEQRVTMRRGDDPVPRPTYFNFVYAPIRNADGAIEAVFAHAYDVTDQVLARQTAQEAVRARDQFLSIASHELRNPVAGIKGAAQLLERSYQAGRLDQDRLERLVRLLVDGSNHLASLTDDLLDVSRLQSGRMPLHCRPVDLAEVVRNLVALQVQQDDMALALDIWDEPCPVVIDPDRVEQVIANLLDNARKYSPSRAQATVTLRREGTGVRITVQDQGIGLPPGTEEQIFQLFSRAPNAVAANISGFGLGLYVCRQITLQHGGRLWAESLGEDQGTSMHLWLPLEPPGAAEGGF